MHQHIKLALKAHNLARSLGMRRAAGYLRNRGVCLNDALVILGFTPRGAQ